MYAQKKNPHKEINFLKSKKKSEPILKINIDLRREQKKKRSMQGPKDKPRIPFSM